MVSSGSGRHVDPAALVDALRQGAELQQGSARHLAATREDIVQLLSAAVDGSAPAEATTRLGSALPGTALGAAAADASTSLLSTTPALQRTGTGAPDTALLLTTTGAALALAGTALEGARRQRVRAAAARGRGRRAAR